MIRFVFSALLLVALMTGLPMTSAASNVPPVSGVAQAETVSQPGLIDRISVWVLTKQREFHRRLTDDLRKLVANNEDWGIVWSLIFGSFLYGVFHALGPGHGKAVVSGYLFTHRQTIRRGIGLAVAASMCQGIVAVLIVYGLVGLAGLLPKDTHATVAWGERASFALVTILGAYLMIRAVRRLIRRRHNTHEHEHDHHHNDDGGGEADCGHSHAPTLQQIESVKDIKSMLAVILSIGIRPCTGAVIVLVFASVASLHWIGIAAVMGMSIGTAITVASLAAFAGMMRENLDKLLWLNGRNAAYIIDLIAIFGGLLILTIGVTLVSTSFAPQHPLVGM